MPTLRIDKDLKDRCYFLTMTIIDWINIFTSDEYFHVVIDSLKYSQTQMNLKLFGYVIMKNHLHLIAQCKDMIRFIQTFKSYTSSILWKRLHQNNQGVKSKLVKKYNIEIGKKKRIWLPRNYPKICEEEFFFNQKLDYIHDNPVVKGYVKTPEDWKYSSASNYYNHDHSVISINTNYEID